MSFAVCFCWSFAVCFCLSFVTCCLSLFVVCFCMSFLVFVCRLLLFVHDNGNRWYLVVRGQCRVVLVGICGAGSLEGGTGWYMVVLGQYGADSLNLEKEN